MFIGSLVIALGLVTFVKEDLRRHRTDKLNMTDTSFLANEHSKSMVSETTNP